MACRLLGASSCHASRLNTFPTFPENPENVRSHRQSTADLRQQQRQVVRQRRAPHQRHVPARQVQERRRPAWCRWCTTDRTAVFAVILRVAVWVLTVLD